MKDIFRILIFLVLPFTVVAQQYDYAKMLGGVAGNDYSQGVVTDNAGNVFMKGVFTGSLQIGSAKYHTSGRDAYICKNDASGNLIWYKSVGFDGAEDATIEGGNIAIDGNNNLYIVGGFYGNATIEGISLTNNGTSFTRDVYVIKYDQNGNIQWARNFGGTDTEIGLSITVDAAENVYVGGYTRSSTILFNGVNQSTNATPQRAAFWAKLNTNGTDSWIKFEGGDGCNCDAVYDMDFAYASGSLFLAGEFASDPFYRSIKAGDGTINWTQNLSSIVWTGEALAIESFGPDLFITGFFDTGDIQFPAALGPVTLTHIGGNDIFLVSVDSIDGFTNWANAYGGTSSFTDEAATDLSINPVTGDIYITGFYDSGLSLMGVTLPGGGPFLAYATNIGGDGTAIGIQVFSYPLVPSGTGVAYDPTNNTLYSTGYYRQDADFGVKQVIQKNATFYVGNNDPGTLAFNWLNTSPKGQIILDKLIVDNNDNVFIAGHFDGTVTVLGTSIESYDISDDLAEPSPDLFVAKINPDESLAWIITATSNDIWNEVRDLTYDGQGAVYLEASFPYSPITIAGVTYPSTVKDRVIVKIDQDGNIIYAKPFNLSSSFGQFAVIQGDNDIGSDTLYMAGYYQGVGVTLQGNVFNSSIADDVFIVAIDGSGNVIPSLITTQSGEGNERVTDMTKRPGGDLFVTGWSDSPNNFAFDGFDLDIDPGNATEIFVASLDEMLFTTGAFIDGGPGDQKAELITIDGPGNIIIAGELFNEGTFSGTVLSFDNTYNSYFIASYSDASGSFNFANEIYEPLGGGTSGSLNALTADGAGNIYLAGNMWLEDLFFDGTTSISTTGQTDGFLAKYDPTGNLLFTEAYGGDYTIGAEAFEGYDYGLTMAVNSLDELWYSGTLVVKSEVFGAFTLQPYGSELAGEQEGMDSYLLRLGSGAAACASPPAANAGIDKIWCEGSNIFINGSFAGASSATWSTNGDGTFFFSTTSLTNRYIPGVNDIADGSLTLILTTDDPDGTGPCIAASDDAVFTIERISLMDAGPDQTVCQGDLVQLAGVIIGEPVDIYWYTSNADGTFDDGSSLTAIYTPGPKDILNGSFQLGLESSPPVCTEESDNITITISQPIIAVDQVASLNVAETTVIDVTNGATIGIGDVITTTLLTQPQKGTTIINADGSISYTALAGTVGNDIFDYEICNQCNLCSSAQIFMNIINVPPVFNVPPSTIIVGGILTRNILADITDDNDNIDLSTLIIIIQPSSGAVASLDASGNLTVDYTGLKFVGTDQLTIEICDFGDLCTVQIIFIEVEPPGVVVYNAVSPNGDSKHDFLEIENAEFFAGNQVKIMNRWGDIVYEIAGYDNDTKKFSGVANKNGSGELPSGTYYYNIVLGDGSKDLTGFFTLRR